MEIEIIEQRVVIEDTVQVVEVEGQSEADITIESRPVELDMGTPGPKGDPGLKGDKGDPGTPRDIENPAGNVVPRRTIVRFSGPAVTVEDDGTRTIVTVSSTGGGVDPTVTKHRLIYELPESHPIAVDEPSFNALVRVEEIHSEAIDTITLQGIALAFESFPLPEDYAALEGNVLEVAPPARDDILLLVTGIEEIVPLPNDLSAMAAAAVEVSPDPVDSSFINTKVTANESVPIPTELAVSKISVEDVVPVAVETDVSGRVRVLTGANASVEDVGGTSALANDANTYGIKDGTTGSMADTSATGAQNKTVRWQFPDLNAFVQSFVITKVELKQYTRWSPGLTAADISVEYRIGSGAWIVWEPPDSLTGSWNVLSAGFAIDITNAIAGSWANVNALEVRAVLTDPASLGAGTGTLTIDAWELIVTTQDKSLL